MQQWAFFYNRLFSRSISFLLFCLVVWGKGMHSLKSPLTSSFSIYMNMKCIKAYQCKIQRLCFLTGLIYTSLFTL